MKDSKGKVPQIREVVSFDELEPVTEETHQKEKQRRKKKTKVYPYVDMVITGINVGQRKTMTGPVTGNQVVIIGKLDSSYTIIGGNKIPGIDIRDAEKIQDIEVSYRCARTREWHKTKPFVIVT